MVTQDQQSLEEDTTINHHSSQAQKKIKLWISNGEVEQSQKCRVQKDYKNVGVLCANALGKMVKESVILVVLLC